MLCKGYFMSVEHYGDGKYKSFYQSFPSPKGAMERRPNTNYIPWKRRTLWRRLMAWWQGEPTFVGSMVRYDNPEALYVITDKGLYCIRPGEDFMRPVLVKQKKEGGL
jgi:hypothetical protein